MPSWFAARLTMWVIQIKSDTQLNLHTGGWNWDLPSPQEIWECELARPHYDHNYTWTLISPYMNPSVCVWNLVPPHHFLYQMYIHIMVLLWHILSFFVTLTESCCWLSCHKPQCRWDHSGIRCGNPPRCHKGWFRCHYWYPPHLLRSLYVTVRHQELWRGCQDRRLLRLSTLWLPHAHTERPQPIAKFLRRI